MTGFLQLPSFGDVNSQLLSYENILTDITYNAGLQTTKIANDFEVEGNFELGTIPKVELKIIDMSNAISFLIEKRFGCNREHGAL